MHEPSTKRATDSTAMEAGMRKAHLFIVKALLACAGALFISTTAAAQSTPAVTCESLRGQRLPTTTISSAEAVMSGGFTPPRATNAIGNLPPFCRVAGVIAPTSDSQIRFEVWLPLSSWNGKFAGVGNGGWAGAISYPQLAEQLRRGYATASTDTGHDATPPMDMARFAAEKPEQLIDFAYRSHHELAMKSKAIVEAFYGKAAAQAYFIGCSSGGYEGLMEAQRFPTDYDGILAGAPANNWTRLMAGTLDFTLAVLQDKASMLAPDALSLLYRGALASCDGIDGVVDGVIEDPRRCTFDPGTLACTASAPAGRCLTSAQVEAARRTYRGPTEPTTGAPLYPGLARGSEAFWPNRNPENPFPIPVSHYRWLVFGDANWDWRTFEFTDAADYRVHRDAEARLAPILNATNPDLREFRTRGGKLLQYHGWNDQLISPQNSIDYYESVAAFFGKSANGRPSSEPVDSFYRLFMAPGMAHCSGGPGPNSFDMQTALEHWVERGVAPEQIIATRSINGVVDRSRPLCAYPKTAVYLGKGDTNDASSFVCRASPDRRP
jgi:Tannase and feruloyl esterase